MSLRKWAAAGAGFAGGLYVTHVIVSWLRYGRAKHSDDALLDRFMPAYEICERHAIDAAAPAAITFAAAKDVEMNQSRIIRAIFRGRELIMRSKPDATPRPAAFLEAVKSFGWGVLADEPAAIVLGAVTKPWEANPEFRALPPEDFAAFAEPGYVKIAWTLRADPKGDTSTFRTETRAVATDAVSRTRFRRYWALLSPGILIIRWVMLGLVKAEAERRAQRTSRNGVTYERQPELHMS